MKKIVYILAIATTCFFGACSEEPVGQTPTNNDTPPPVADPKVENIAGGARIYYTLPQGEADISYVRAEYMYKGKLVSNKSSVYKNFVLIEGFANTDPVEVKLYTINHSEKTSEPMIATIHPLTPPVFNITKSFKFLPDFGGLKINWENETGDEVVVTLLTYDEGVGDYTDQDAYYSSAKTGQFTFRGYEPELTRFGFYVRDKYFNISDTVRVELTPMREVPIKADNFARVMNIPGDDLTSLGGWPFHSMWDGIIHGDQGWHNADDPSLGNRMPRYFTWDLGMTAKLSRFTLWHRNNIPYGNANIKKFELWGSSEYQTGKPKEYYYKGGEWETDGNWSNLGTFEVIKPSGEGNQITNEDKEFMNNGFEFVIPLEIKPVRYLRFVALSNWSSGPGLHITEIKYWGDDTLQK